MLLLNVPTDQRPLPGADAHAVGSAGRELGPVGQLTVVLAGQLTLLADCGHGLGELQALIDVSLRPVQLAARNSCKKKKKEKKTEGFVRKCAFVAFIIYVSRPVVKENEPNGNVQS